MRKKILNGKKIILYGDERYIRDFLYVFDDIEPIYCVIDSADDFKDSWQKLKNENPNEVMIIVCKFDVLQTFCDLRKAGFKRGENYVSAETCFSWLDFPVEEISQVRDTFVWGTGEDSSCFFKDYLAKHREIQIVGTIDSDPDKAGHVFFEKPVYFPDDVIKEDYPFVIIATRRYYWEIRQKLESYGLKNREDFISFTGINHHASEMMRRTMTDVPKTGFLCEKPFFAYELKPEGRTLICGGMHETYEKTESLYYSDFRDVWSSNVLKVVRLSCVNGTYTFCDPVICCHVRESKKGYPKNTVLKEKNYKKKELKYPSTIQMGFDESCNLHCPSCRKNLYYADAQKTEELREVKERIYKEIIPHASRIKIAGLGEAFASIIYREMIFDKELARQLKSIGIISNGSLFTPETFDKLSSMWENIDVFISMDGACQSTAEKLRSGIDFQKWKLNMEYLGRMRVKNKIKKLAFNFVVQKDNYLEMSDYVKMCLGFHADYIKFSMLSNWGNWTKDEFNEFSLIKENGEIKEELADVIKDEIFQRPEVFLFRWIDW